MLFLSHQRVQVRLKVSGTEASLNPPALKELMYEAGTWGRGGGGGGGCQKCWPLFR